MQYLFIMLVMLPTIAITAATVYTTARHWAVRCACYRRASLGSLIRGAKRNALTRYMGRA